YYKWYKEELYDNYQNNEETMPDSSIQALLKGELFAFLRAIFSRSLFTITVGEQGLHLKKKSWRGADIAIFKRENFILDNKFAKLPPEIIVEINIKGYYETQEQAFKYFERKNNQLFAFGVKKIIWVFTESKSVQVVTPQGSQDFDWDEDVEVMEGVRFNVQALIDGYFQAGKED
ncbi:MAG: hypothetical protein AAB316_19700, partial [Bacteroidota bacterium]